MTPTRFAARMQASFLRAGPPLLLIGLIIYLGAEQGGFFPEAAAAAAVALAAALILRTALAKDPFAGFGLVLASAAAPLGLFAAWTLVSALWSEAPGRALVEFDRVLLYVLALLFFGSYARSLRRARGLVRALALAATVLCTAAFLSRALPDVFEVSPGFLASRLDFPLTYWNALGLLAAIGLVLCLSLTSDERESSPVRVVSAAAMPVLAATLLLTFSRGAMAVGVVALAAYVVLAHNRGLATGLLAAAPLTAVAVVRAYEADLLATQNPTSPPAVMQGHELAGVVLLCAVGAAAVRSVLLLVDGQLRRLDVSGGERRGALAAGAGVLALAAVVVAVAADLPTLVDRQYQQFARGAPIQSTGAATRDRLASASSPARLDYWRVARGSFEEASLAGKGAGTFETEWKQRRRNPNSPAVDAHSLYLETAAELGVVGVLLLATVLVSIVVGLAWSARGRHRAPWVALLCCASAPGRCTRPSTGTGRCPRSRSGSSPPEGSPSPRGARIRAHEHRGGVLACSWESALRSWPSCRPAPGSQSGRLARRESPSTGATALRRSGHPSTQLTSSTPLPSPMSSSDTAMPDSAATISPCG